MKILLVTGMFPPIRTGTSFFSFNLANALLDKGHDVTVLTLEESAADVGGDELADVGYVKRIPSIRLSLPVFKHFRVCSILPKSYHHIVSLASNNKPDVILLINQYLDIAIPAVFCSKRLGIPLVCVVGTQIQSPNAIKNYILNVADRLICGRMIFSRCSRILAWDSEIVRYLKNVHGDQLSKKVAVSGYGVHGNIQELLMIERDYSIKNQIIGVGAVIAQRNYRPVIEAFALIANEFPKLSLKIIGHVYLKEVEHLVESLDLSERIIFAGELPHADVVRELSRSDVFWAPPTGYYKGLGTATIEAMLSGLPAFVNADEEIVGSPRLIDMQHAILTPGRTSEELANLLRQLLTDEELRSRIGQNGRDFVQQTFQWKSVAKRVESILQEAVIQKVPDDIHHSDEQEPM